RNSRRNSRRNLDVWGRSPDPCPTRFANLPPLYGAAHHSSCSGQRSARSASGPRGGVRSSCPNVSRV
ncbi:hypothetical protein HK102_005343, partial [Quaeritorhiza haematococci]